MVWEVKAPSVGIPLSHIIMTLSQPVPVLSSPNNAKRLARNWQVSILFWLDQVLNPCNPIFETHDLQKTGDGRSTHLANPSGLV